MRIALLAVVLVLAPLARAQTDAPAATPPAAKPGPVPKLTKAQMTSAELQKTVDQLTQSNRDLLALLKQQQTVLQDIQFDRRLQGRQIQSLEEKLEGALFQNNQLQTKVATLSAEASVRGSAPAPTAAPNGPVIESVNTPPAPPPAVLIPAPPPPPSTYLRPPETEGAPGTMSWHRLFTLKGEDSRQSDTFQVRGKTWRVLWHNLDKPGKDYVNTSALFINAFPKDDTIPQKVCAKLGSGGDSSELQGPGNYYLKIEASGGSWELAVEDFR